MYETLGGSGTVVWTIAKNGTSTSLTFTQTAGDTTREYSDIANSFTVVAGDKICIKIVSGTITSNSGRMSGGSIQFDPS